MGGTYEFPGYNGKPVECKACDAGRSSGTRSSACTNCAAGRYSDSNTAFICTHCAGGKYMGSQGATACTTCAAGKIAASSGRTACSDCSSGRYSAAGAVSCTDCPGGKHGGSTGVGSCTNCVAGKYSTGRTSSCSNCVAGKAQSAAGKSSCTACPSGKYAEPGITACKNAPSGKVAHPWDYQEQHWNGNIDSLMKENTCTCPCVREPYSGTRRRNAANCGTAATGTACTSANAGICASCNTYWQKSGNSCGFNNLVANQCYYIQNKGTAKDLADGETNGICSDTNGAWDCSKDNGITTSYTRFKITSDPNDSSDWNFQSERGGDLTTSTTRWCADDSYRMRCSRGHRAQWERFGIEDKGNYQYAIKGQGCHHGDSNPHWFSRDGTGTKMWSKSKYSTNDKYLFRFLKTSCRV